MYFVSYECIAETDIYIYVPKQPNKGMHSNTSFPSNSSLRACFIRQYCLTHSSLPCLYQLLSHSLTASHTTINFCLTHSPPAIPLSTTVSLAHHQPYHYQLLSHSLTTSHTTINYCLTHSPPPIPLSTTVSLTHHHPYHYQLLSHSLTTSHTTINYCLTVVEEVHIGI